MIKWRQKRNKYFVKLNELDPKKHKSTDNKMEMRKDSINYLGTQKESLKGQQKTHMQKTQQVSENRLRKLTDMRI